MADRSFDVPEQQSRFIDAQVERGTHRSASEVVGEALRRYEADLAPEVAEAPAGEAVASPSVQRENLADMVRRLFGPEGGVELDLPPRGPGREPPELA